jgi:hypothetical protein
MYPHQTARSRHVRIEVPDVKGYCEFLNGKRYRYVRPGFQEMPWGTTDMSINDPSGNKLTFYSATEV